MTPQALKELDSRLASFLQELTEPMGRSERRHWARVYLEGLLLDGERKSVEPMAARIRGADVQALRQFLSQSPWEVAEVQRRLALKVVDTLNEPELWILDETSFPKAGNHSVGVARQYCGALGKIANCQVAVSLHWSSAEASCPLSWRLYLPEEWLADRQRAVAVKLPTELKFQSKTDLALELIDQALEWQLPALPIVADSAYGNSFVFRQALRERRLQYVVAVEPTTVVWTANPNLPLPKPKVTGRLRRYLGSQSVGLRRLVRLARGRWRIEQDYRELKEELGLDHFEGRHWLGWHHHVTLVSMAFAFLRLEQARAKKNSWYDLAAGPETTTSAADPA